MDAEIMKIDETNAEHYLWGDGCDGWHLLKTDGLSVIKERVPPGRGERRHFHRSARQFFYILEGEAVLEIEGTEHRLAPGQGIEVPPGSPHRFRNGSEADVVFLVVSSPKSHGDRVDVEPAAQALAGTTAREGDGAAVREGTGTAAMPALRPLTDAAVPAVKDLIADAVLEFYGDLDFLPKDREGLLRYYGETGYLRDLDGHASVYRPGDGVFLVLHEGEAVIGCGGLRRLGDKDAELVRLWLRRDRRKRGLGRMLLERLLREAGALGYARIFLDTSHRCADAVRLFRRNGFADCAPYKKSIGEVFLRRDF